MNRFARREQRIIQEINSDINNGLAFSSNQLSRRGSFGKSSSNYSKIGTTINFRPQTKPLLDDTETPDIINDALSE